MENDPNRYGPPPASKKAIESFKGFEKKDKIMMAMASNNISFLYFLENDFKNAE
jgi:intraflagellar transport protein 88